MANSLESFSVKAGFCNSLIIFVILQLDIAYSAGVSR